MSNDQCYTEQEREQGLGSVVVVEPGKPAYTKQIAFTLESLQREVDGYIEAIYPFEEQVAIICNEEGKLDGRALNRALRDDAGERGLHSAHTRTTGEVHRVFPYTRDDCARLREDSDCSDDCVSAHCGICERSRGV